ncbi:MAG: MBL fold metallo-hydrolase [Ignavibacteria bacterium]|nr:MBL fold metallo-hydrolase [Ignavibacteria bacterium]
MFFQHVYEKGLAQSSYFIGCQKSGVALVIDPKRDIETYLQIAKQEKLTITHVTETHIHADFLSGARELAGRTGAELLLSDEGGLDWQYQFKHTSLKDGSEFWIGNLKIEVLHTPGHTPEHISFLLTDTPASSKPVMFFSGDFVFVGDVGRPDLLEKAAGVVGTMDAGARQMYKSLQRFKQLPDYIQLWSGHGAGSACGKALGAVPSSTIGYEKISNWALQYEDEDAFVAELLSGQPEPPKYFAMMKKLNKIGPPILGNSFFPNRLSAYEMEAAYRQGMTIIDTRNKFIFADGHIPGSLNIQDNNALSTWAGWMLDYDKPFVVIATDKSMPEITNKLIRIGLDQIYGYFPSIEEWTDHGGELTKLRQMSVEDLSTHLGDPNYTVIDVRATSEFNGGHIEGAHHIHAGYLSGRLEEVPRTGNLVIQCAGGDRSSIASSLLLRAGITNIYNLIGGIGAWREAGLTTVKSN